MQKHLTPHLLDVIYYNTSTYGGEVLDALLTTPHLISSHLEKTSN